MAPSGTPQGWCHAPSLAAGVCHQRLYADSLDFSIYLSINANSLDLQAHLHVFLTLTKTVARTEMSCSSSNKFPKDLLRVPLPALPTATGTVPLGGAATPGLPLGFLLAPLIPPGTKPLGGTVTLVLLPPGTMPLGGAATPGLPLALTAIPACHPVVREVSAWGNKCADSQPAEEKLQQCGDK